MTDMDVFNNFDDALDHMNNNTIEYEGIGWIQSSIEIVYGEHNELFQIHCDRLDVFGKKITSLDLKKNILLSLNEPLDTYDALTDKNRSIRKKAFLTSEKTKINEPVKIILKYSARNDPHCQTSYNNICIKCNNMDDFKRKFQN